MDKRKAEEKQIRRQIRKQATKLLIYKPISMTLKRFRMTSMNEELTNGQK